MMRTRTSAAPAPRLTRSGATLTEVLMALLIMSVGIVSVFTLFPISILSSIRATQLTNTKLLEENAVETLRSFPELFVPPAGMQWNQSETGLWRGNWSPNTLYNEGDYVIPTRKPGGRWPSPGVLLRCVNPGRSGAVEPNWPSFGTTITEGYDPGNPLGWQVINLAASTRGNYIIDPLGYDDTPPRHRFGNRILGSLPQSPLRRSNVPFPPPPGNNHLPFAQAQQIFSLGDSWSVALEVMPQNISGTTVTLPPSVTVSPNDFTIAQSRVVFTNLDETSSIVRSLASGTGGNVLELGQPVPGGFGGRLRIETFTPRYTCFLAVNHSSPHRPPRVSCAIVFNRSYNLDHEHIYNANFGNPAYDGIATVSNPNLQQDQVKIAWETASQPEPLLRENNFIMDARQAIFYRITSVGRRDTVTQPGTTSVVLTLDRGVEFATGFPDPAWFPNADPTSPDPDQVGWAILMPGIVNVYEL
jgi:type II secretory pathway pseudopilin PulG